MTPPEYQKIVCELLNRSYADIPIQPRIVIRAKEILLIPITAMQIHDHIVFKPKVHHFTEGLAAHEWNCLTREICLYFRRI